MTKPASTPAAALVPPESEKWVLLASIIGSGMAFIDTTALNVALPALQADLHVSGAQLLWIVNAYALFLSSLILVGGSIGDRYGRKRIFAIGISLFALASLVCGLAPNVEVLIAARAVKGIGGAMMVPGSLAILSASFAPERRGQAIGTWSMFSTLTTTLGPVIGGWLASQGLWRFVFFINLPLAAVALAALLLRVPESRDHKAAAQQLDLPGALLATLGLGGLSYGFIQAPDFGLTDGRIILALGGGIAALIAFLIVEARSDHPMMPLTLFRSRTFSGANALTFFLYAALNGTLFFFPLNLVQVQGYPAQIAGFAMLPFALLLMVLARRSGWLVQRIGVRPLLTLGPLIAGIGFFMYGLPGLTDGPSDYWTHFMPAVIVLGVGMGLTIAPLTTAVMGAAPIDKAGTASGINNALARSANVLAVAMLGALAIVQFSAALERRVEPLNLPDAAQAQLAQEARQLAGAEPPAGLDSAATESVAQAIRLSFLEAYRLVTLIGAGLAWLGALMGFLLIEGKLRPQRSGV